MSLFLKTSHHNRTFWNDYLQGISYQRQQHKMVMYKTVDKYKKDFLPKTGLNQKMYFY